MGRQKVTYIDSWKRLHNGITNLLFIIGAETMNRAFALAILACCGCGSGDQTCASVDSGTYLMHYVERSGGTCGPVTDQLANLADTGPACTIESESTSADNCSAEMSYSCPVTGTTWIADFVSVMHSSVDGSKATGTITMTAKTSAGATVCISTYDLTATRQ